jgi:hypothetical protein
MNMLRRKSSIRSPRRMTVFGLCVVILFTLQLPFYGLAQTRDSVLVIEPAIRSLDVAQIPEFAQKTRKLISDIQRITSSDKDLTEISHGTLEVLNILNEKDSLLSDSLKLYRMDQLDQEDRQLSLLDVRLTQWKYSIEDMIHDGREKDSMAVNVIGVWQLTLDSIIA